MTPKERFLEWWIRPEMYYIKWHTKFLWKEGKYTGRNKLLETPYCRARKFTCNHAA